MRAAARDLMRCNVVHSFQATPVASTSRHIQFSAPALSSKKKEEPAPSALHTRNENIPFRVVKMVDETGRLGNWVPLSDIIQDIKGDKDKRKKYYVELVSEKPEPIVKLIRASEVYNKKRAQADRKKIVRDQKEVQLSWAISEADLAHKLEKVREELELGNRVDLAYLHKSGQTIPTKEEMEARAEETLKALEDAGAPWKPLTSTKTSLILHLQGHNDPAAAGTLDLRAHMAEQAGKKLERRQKNEERRRREEERQRKVDELRRAKQHEMGS